MPKFFKSQSNFTLGELTPRLQGRVDFEGYYKGARKVRNLLVIPQGGVIRRFGMRYITQITGVTSQNQFRIYNFSINDVDKYLLVFTNLQLKIYYEGALVATVVTIYGVADLPDLNFVQTTNTLIIAKGDKYPQKLVRTSRHGGWTISNFTIKVFPVFDFTENYNDSLFSLAAASGENVAVTITSGTAAFLPAHVGGVLVGDGTGIGRIISYTSSTVVNVDIETTFPDTTFYGTRAFLAQPAWSDALGWPTAVGFYQNRLVFVNTATLVGGLWLSVTNKYSTFDEFLATGADAAISDFIQSRGVNAVKNVLGVRSLIVFTSDGEYANGTIEQQGLTSDNFSMTQQTPNGISNVIPVSIDNQIIFVDAGGQMVHAMQYNIQSGSYETINISLFSEQLINNPTYSAVYRNPDVDDGTYLFLVNTDGTLATFQSVLNQNVKGWSMQTTPGGSGKFVEVVSERSHCWFAVKRTINSSDVFYVEQLDFNYLTDSAIKYSGVATTTITGLSHLEGQTVKVITEHGVLNDEVVSSGQITIDKASTTVEVGLDFTNDIDLTLMPININTQTGPDLYSPKHVNTIYVDYQDSLGITVNGVEIPNLILDESVLGQAPALQSGVAMVTPMLGWDPFASIKISQSNPAKMLIRGIGLEVQLDDTP